MAHHPEAISHYPQSMQILIRLLHNRQEQGRNAMVPVVGPTGIGKSYTVLAIMEGLYLYQHGVKPSAEYLISHVDFKAKDFLTHMKKYSDALANDTKLELASHLWDETGIDASSRSWQSAQNKVLGFYAQTCRNQRQIIFFTTPSLTFLDINLRKLMHYYIEVASVDRKNNMAVIKPLEIQYNLRQDKIYYHNLTYPTKEGMLEVEFVAVPKIDSELAAAYEKVKSKFTANLNNEIILTLNKLDQKTNPEANLTERQKIILEHWKRGEFRTEVIGKAAGMKPQQVSENTRFLKNKGFYKENYKENAVLKGNVPIEPAPELNSYIPPTLTDKNNRLTEQVEEVNRYTE